LINSVNFIAGLDSAGDVIVVTKDCDIDCREDSQGSLLRNLLFLAMQGELLNLATVLILGFLEYGT